MTVIEAFFRENHFLEEHELLITVLTCLMSQVFVLVRIHQADPLFNRVQACIEFDATTLL